MRTINLAVVGATGLVGEAIIKLLADRKVPVGELHVLASENGAGSRIGFAGRSLTVADAAQFDFSQVEVAIFAAGAPTSQALAPVAAEAGALVVDLSPAYRYDEAVPLIVADVNDELLAQARETNMVACADAGTVQLLRVLKPINDLAPVQEVVVTQLQAASATGRSGVDQLAQQSVRLLNGMTPSEDAKAQIAFNALPVSGQVQENGYSSEELKLVLESRRVLAGQPLSVQVTTVRVPVFYGHGQSVSIRAVQPLSAGQVMTVWDGLDDLVVQENDDPQAMSPVAMVEGDPQVRVSRIREDMEGTGAISYFSVADNVRWGAALNAVKIVEKLLKDYL
ncbi:aspartate-semialdehyde dehydrogenase [Alcanivorax sp. DP30]|uniref:aspartate-semialdehyde dehydrogenase n=1 Tax=Alcanivorax sp. DP30 TaxID=2606217 RepID=UPI001369AFE1|nr:aspartate-semialdehyde dehydrogenase [Alcanivorax sp. DP30]MZR61616.1 aspartate-semialdehyde dehydrogenase [Alcanivorax sp. DP30]